MLRSALTIQAGRFVWAESEGREVARDSGTGGLTGIHPTKDGALYISVHSNHFWAALCDLIGRPELATDRRCVSMRSRAEHAAELFDHTQVLAEDLVTTLEHPVVGRYRTMTKPIKLSDTPGPAPAAAPVFAQHTEEVLTAYGYSVDEIAALRERGVVT